MSMKVNLENAEDKNCT